MEIFIDTTKRAEISRWLGYGVVDGVTTNPAIMLKDGVSDARAEVRAIAKLVGKRRDETTLFVNGKPVMLNHFAQDIVTGTMLGILSALKGVEKDIKSVEVTFRKKVG